MILGRCTPFKIVYTVVCLIAVDVIHIILAAWLINKGLCHFSVNPKVNPFSFVPDDDLYITTFINLKSIKLFRRNTKPSEA